MRYNNSIKSKLYKYFTERVGLKRSTKGYLRGDCPNCGGKYTFGVNIERRSTNCFKHCDPPRDPIALLSLIEGFEELSEAYNYLKIQQEYDAYDRVVRGKEKALEKREVTLPKGFKLLAHGDGILAKVARGYMKGRGFDLNKLTLLGVGYCDTGEYMGYIIFPFLRRGSLDFFQGRNFAASGPKMKNPAEEDFGIGKNQLIYNRDALFIYNRVYVVESITNAITLGERAIALLGKKASHYQISALINNPCEELVIMLDPDALEEAINLALTLCQFKRVKLVYWEGNKDVNDMGKSKALKLAKQFNFQTYNELFKLKKNKIWDASTLNTYNRANARNLASSRNARVGRRQLL